MDDALPATLLMELRRVAVPVRAPAMQAYMKSPMPYLGVRADDLRAACRRTFAGLVFPSATAWRRAALSLWRPARYREERYAAIVGPAAPPGGRHLSVPTVRARSADTA